MKIIAVCDRAVTLETMEPMRELEKYGAEVVLFNDDTMAANDDLTATMIRYEREGCDACAANPKLLAQVKDADIIAIHTSVVNTQVIEAAPRLKLVAVMRSGTENVQERLCGERGIRIVSAPGRSAHSVADMTVGMMLAEMKNIARGHKYLMDGRWVKEYPNVRPEFCIHDLRNCTVGIVGAGQIGQKVISRLRGFECKIVVHDPFLSGEAVKALGYTPVTLEELLAQSDIVSVHLRLSEKTQNFFGAREFSQMKRTAYFINTARAGLVDEPALIEALQNRRIVGAGLDVFCEEPLSLDSPFLKLDNVTITPHVAGTSADTFANSVEIIREELAKLFESGAI